MLVVARKAWGEPREVVVARAPVPPLPVERKALARIGHVQIPTFRETAAGQVRTAVELVGAKIAP